jgi:hypothetical protein
MLASQLLLASAYSFRQATKQLVSRAFTGARAHAGHAENTNTFLGEVRRKDSIKTLFSTNLCNTDCSCPEVCVRTHCIERAAKCSCACKIARAVEQSKF